MTNHLFGIWLEENGYKPTRSGAYLGKVNELKVRIRLVGNVALIEVFMPKQRGGSYVRSWWEKIDDLVTGATAPTESTQIRPALIGRLFTIHATDSTQIPVET